MHQVEADALASLQPICFQTREIYIWFYLIISTLSPPNSATMSTRPARMTMLFDFFKKKAVVAKPVDTKFKPLTGSAVSSCLKLLIVKNLHILEQPLLTF